MDTKDRLGEKGERNLELKAEKYAHLANYGLKNEK
jgi:hypothetical protein